MFTSLSNSKVMLGCKAFRWSNRWNYFKHTHQFTPTIQTHHSSSKKKQRPTINHSSNHAPNKKSPTPKKAILACNKPQAWRLHLRGIVINTKHTNQPNCQYKLNAKQGYTSLMIKTPSITHSFTLNFSIFAKKKLRGAPITIIISNTSYHVKLLVGEFFKVWESSHVRLPPP